MRSQLHQAIRTADAAEAVLRKTETFPDQHWLPLSEKSSTQKLHFGVEPMLLALSMELALKAWYILDHNKMNVPKTHNLVKLFDLLMPASQYKLDNEYRESVLPWHRTDVLDPWNPSFRIEDIDDAFRNFLAPYKDAFIDWRYMHEVGTSGGFESVEFVAALEMVLREFRKRYRKGTVWPTFGSDAPD